MIYFAIRNGDAVQKTPSIWLRQAAEYQQWFIVCTFCVRQFRIVIFESVRACNVCACSKLRSEPKQCKQRKMGENVTHSQVPTSYSQSLSLSVSQSVTRIIAEVAFFS